LSEMTYWKGKTPIRRPVMCGL